METILLRNVSRIFEAGENRIQALTDVNLAVKKGQFLAVIGSSGSGKSTLLNILGCLDSPTRGEYVLEGHRVSDLNGSDLADIRNRRIGLVFQRFNLLARRTALQNVELPLIYDRSRRIKNPGRAAREALERVGLAGRFDHFPNQLSGGQQQRAAIARALVVKPAILLADEPTGNLDSRTSLEIMDLFQDLNREGIAIVMMTHERNLVGYAEREIEMRDGTVIGDRKVADHRDAHLDLAGVMAPLSSRRGLDQDRQGVVHP